MDKIKEKADKMRSMSDKELVAYVENRVKKAYSEGFNKGRKTTKQEVDNGYRRRTEHLERQHLDESTKEGACRYNQVVRKELQDLS